MSTIRDQLLRELPDATVVTRAPGRVNLIGEHTDYNGFPVLPMAIEESVWIAMAPRRDGLLHIRNLQSVRYPEEMIGIRDIADRPRRGFWSDYVIAAARAVPELQGAELVVGSDLPPATGLSSSAALVVASLLALRGRDEPAEDRRELARLAADAERFVGTNAGGMDQAISLLAEKQHALRIDFRPLRVARVALPSDLTVVVIDSGIRAEKGGAVQAAYNERVAQCAQAAHLLGAPEGGLLADVPESARAGVSGLDDAILRRRAGFVFAEVDRVDAAVHALEAADLAGFGALLDASHAGLRDEYEVSHPAVDEVVERARSKGALGARIVGAGFGGSAIAAVPKDGVDRVLAEFGSTARVVSPGAGAEFCA